MRFLVVLIVFFASAAVAATQEDVVIEGPLVMSEEVYRAILSVPEETDPSATLTDVLALQLERFLREAGYELAKVTGSFADGKMKLVIEEGLLEKIVFHGRLTFDLVRLRIALNLPRNVFNRPSLDRQLTALTAEFKISPPPRWELVPSQRLKHNGPQLGEAESRQLMVEGHPLVFAQADWELHLYMPDPEWSTGPGIDIRSGYYDGFEVGPSFQGSDLFSKGDRWRVSLMGGIGVRQDMVQNAFYAYPSRGFGEAMWFSPELAPNTRFQIWARSEFLNRQRRDQNLELYYSVASDVSANVVVKPTSGLTVTAGFGGQHFYLFGQRAPSDQPELMAEPISRFRGNVELGLEQVWDDAEGRWDRRHSFFIDGKLWYSTMRTQMLDLRATYQKVFAFGWHDLIIKGRGRWMAGDVLFAFEEPLGEYLRAVFGDVWMRAVVGLRGEFRFSLTRDIYKVGVFVDTATYGTQDPITGKIEPRAGVAFGPGFHALIASMFQVDVNLSFGLLSTGRFNLGLFVFLYKIF